MILQHIYIWLYIYNKEFRGITIYFGEYLKIIYLIRKLYCLEYILNVYSKKQKAINLF